MLVKRSSVEIVGVLTVDNTLVARSKGLSTITSCSNSIYLQSSSSNKIAVFLFVIEPSLSTILIFCLTLISRSIIGLMECCILFTNYIHFIFVVVMYFSMLTRVLWLI